MESGRDAPALTGPGRCAQPAAPAARRPPGPPRAPSPRSPPRGLRSPPAPRPWCPQSPTRSHSEPGKFEGRPAFLSLPGRPRSPPRASPPAGEPVRSEPSARGRRRDGLCPVRPAPGAPEARGGLVRKAGCGRRGGARAREVGGPAPAPPRTPRPRSRLRPRGARPGAGLCPPLRGLLPENGVPAAGVWGDVGSFVLSLALLPLPGSTLAEPTLGKAQQTLKLNEYN